MQAIFALIQKLAPSSASVLIAGQSGTDKELVAREIHNLSPRRNGPFIAINTAALPEDLIESELFGHEKGAFIGAVERHLGCFEQAHGGTLFLDEIGEMPRAAQPRLLRILEDLCEGWAAAPKSLWMCGCWRRQASPGNPFERRSLLPFERISNPASSASVTPGGHSADSTGHDPDPEQEEWNPGRRSGFRSAEGF